MKIEKVSNSQIKCTLDQIDLMNRHIKLSELAYGTEKAQTLFKDMMEQAYQQFGFEVSDVPLMIEAIPTSTDSILLIITKVESDHQLEDEIMQQEGSIRKFKKRSNEPNILPAKKDLPNKGSGDAPTVYESHQAFPILYKFASLDLVTLASRLVITHVPIDLSSLFKDASTNKYYLLIPEYDDIASVCEILGEYGERVLANPMTSSYLNEHFEVMIKDKAISRMKDL